MPRDDKRLPPLAIRPGETWFVSWPREGDEVNVQLRQPGTGARVFTARATYPADLFRRPPTAATADWIRTELEDEFRNAIDSARTNRRPKRPRW